MIFVIYFEPNKLFRDIANMIFKVSVFTGNLMSYLPELFETLVCVSLKKNSCNIPLYVSDVWDKALFRMDQKLFTAGIRWHRNALIPLGTVLQLNLSDFLLSPFLDSNELYCFAYSYIHFDAWPSPSRLASPITANVVKSASHIDFSAFVPIGDIWPPSDNLDVIYKTNIRPLL